MMHTPPRLVGFPFLLFRSSHNMRLKLTGKSSALLLCLLVFGLQAPAGQAQDNLLLPSVVSEQLGNEISGGIAARTVEQLLNLQQTSQPENYYRSFKYLETRAKELGLFKIRLSEIPETRIEWDVRKAELWMLSPVTRKLANFHENPAALAAFSHTNHTMVELVDVGAGVQKTDYAGKNVENKIVLARGPLNRVVREAVWQRGALGILSYQEQEPGSESRHANSDHWQVLPISNGKASTFAFAIPSQTANDLKQILQTSSERTTFGRDKISQAQTAVLLRVDIDASVRKVGKSWHLMAEIPGEEVLNEDIVISAVLPDNAAPPFHDFSGAAGLLEIARTLTRLINDGLLPLPRRTIRFWWLPDKDALQTHFIKRPDTKDSLLVNLHLDTIGHARQNDTGARLALAPQANMTYWNDIMQVLASGMAKQIAMQSTETTNRLLASPSLFSPKNPHAPFSLDVVSNSSHEVVQFFSQSAFALPSAVLSGRFADTLTSRSQLIDELDTIQYKRNLFLASAATWYLSRLTDDDIPALVAKIYQSSQVRLAHTLKIAFERIIQDEKLGYLLADLVIEESIAREAEALQSASVLASHSDALEIINDFLNSYRDDAKSAQNRIKLLYSGIYQRRPPRVQLDANAKAALRIVPRNVQDLSTYLDRQKKLTYSAMSFWEYEVLNFVNGQRSVYDIYRAVLAESILVPGKPHPEITLTFVQATIGKAAENGLLDF